MITGGLVRVMIATTDGPVEIEALNRLDFQEAKSGRRIDQSFAQLSRPSPRRSSDIPILEWLSDQYHLFTSWRTGIIGRLYGHNSFQLVLSDPIENGSSWQLGVLLAHALEAEGRLAENNKNANGQAVETVVLATGEVDWDRYESFVDWDDLAVKRVKDLSVKLEKAFDGLRQQVKAGLRVIAVWPKDNHADALHWIPKLEEAQIEYLAADAARTTLEFFDIEPPEPSLQKAEEPEDEPWSRINPYRGLEALREEDARFLVCREAETAAALHALARSKRSIVTLVGNSGVGKSSLVEAGIFAALKRQEMPRRDGEPEAWPAELSESGQWAFMTVQPGEDPLLNLVSAFMKLWFEDPTDPNRVEQRHKWSKLLKEGESNIVELLDLTEEHFRKQARRPPTAVLLNINQFEELYSLTPEPLRELFSKLVAQGLADPRFRALASLRTDYYGSLQENEHLFDRDSIVDVRPFTAVQLKTVIEGPAHLLGARFESDELPDYIVKSAAGQKGALALLSFYMTDLWERMQSRRDGVLRLADPRKVVDVARMLAARADRFLDEHPNDLPAIKRLFTLKLALVQEEGKPVRQPASRANLTDQEWRLVEMLSGPDWRLLVTGDDTRRNVGEDTNSGAERDETVRTGAYAEVAHDILLESWGTLAGWLESEREFLVFKGRCKRARERWKNSGFDPRALLYGLDLIQAEQWLEERGQDFETDVADFIRDSVAAAIGALASRRRFERRVKWGAVIAAIILALLEVRSEWIKVKRERTNDELLKVNAQLRDAMGLVNDLADRVSDRTARAEILKRLREVMETDPSNKELDRISRKLSREIRGDMPPVENFGTARMLAEKGDADAMKNLGLAYAQGSGVRQDYAEASKWLTMAAAKGNAEAMRLLGLLYDNGYGVGQDYAKAREWYEKAAAKGDAVAMRLLGLLYDNGQGVPQDYVKAREWYEKAAAKFDDKAMRLLGILYDAGEGVEQSYVKAREWYEKAAAEGDPISMRFIGDFYRDGSGVAQDYVQARKWYEKASAKDDAVAMRLLGLLYGNGYGVPKDYAKAREWFEKSAARDDAGAMRLLGLLYDFGQGVVQNYVKARELYERAAERDDAPAMRRLGLLYDNGYGVAQDYGKAREWYEKAAAKDDAAAMTMLGLLYANGQGVTQDYGAARRWFEKAAVKGESDAMGLLGLLFYNGQGVTQDYGKAREWFEKAAASEDAASMRLLGTLYNYGQGVAQDFSKAREWYEKAAAKEDARAMRLLGLLYEYGQGVEQDFVKAHEWYQKAAARDDGAAMRLLGLLYANGQGVAQNYAKAREWYEKAAARDDATAMRLLGLMYGGGQGMEQNYAKAREWFEKAAARDDGRAMRLLGILYENGFGVAPDQARAAEWYAKAASREDVPAMRYLGQLYEYGQGVGQDYRKAREWYEKAAAQEDPIAMRLLGLLYMNGREAAPDYALAREWYDKAAARDDAIALRLIGVLFEIGKGAPKDAVKAREWYEKAAAKGDGVAMRYLGDFYRDGTGVERDYAKAREWFEKAAAKDDAPAMRSIGQLYDFGDGVEQDLIKAREWYEKAAANDDAVAMRFLGILYMSGEGVAPNYTLARDWYDKAAARDDVVSLRLIGFLFETGKGVPKDEAQAREWYEKAAAKGDGVAMRYLGDFYRDGTGVERDYTKAREWYQKAVAKGDKPAERALSRLSAQEAFSDHRYGEAVKLMEAIAQAAEAEEVAERKSAGKATASAQNSLAWYRLFARDFRGALAAAEKALSISPGNLVYETNKAHALMLLGKIDEARSIYFGNKQASLEGLGSWEAVILKDFEELEAAGVTHPQMREVKVQLAYTLKKHKK